MKYLKKCAILFLTPFLFLTGCTNSESNSITFIGGADGPTAIYITGAFGTVLSAIIYALLLVILGFGIAVMFKNMRK